MAASARSKNDDGRTLWLRALARCWPCACGYCVQGDGADLASSSTGPIASFSQAACLGAEAGWGPRPGARRASRPLRAAPRSRQRPPRLGRGRGRLAPRPRRAWRPRLRPRSRGSQGGGEGRALAGRAARLARAEALRARAGSGRRPESAGPGRARARRAPAEPGLSGLGAFLWVTQIARRLFSRKLTGKAQRRRAAAPRLASAAPGRAALGKQPLFESSLQPAEVDPGWLQRRAGQRRPRRELAGLASRERRPARGWLGRSRSQRLHFA